MNRQQCEKNKSNKNQMMNRDIRAQSEPSRKSERGTVNLIKSKSNAINLMMMMMIVAERCHKMTVQLMNTRNKNTHFRHARSFAVHFIIIIIWKLSLAWRTHKHTRTRWCANSELFLNFSRLTHLIVSHFYLTASATLSMLSSKRWMESSASKQTDGPAHTCMM